MTLSEVKEYLRLDLSDTTFDNEIMALIAAARTATESFQNRAYMERTYELAFDSFPDMPLVLPMPPLIAVESITYTDKDGQTGTVALTDLIVDPHSEPGRIAFVSGISWPSVTLQPVNGVIVRFKAGNNTPPENVKLAIKFFVGFRFENPETEDIPEAFYNLLWPDRLVPV